VAESTLTSRPILRVLDILAATGVSMVSGKHVKLSRNTERSRSRSMRRSCWKPDKVESSGTQAATASGGDPTLDPS
jgi:hypothetical protein